MSNHNLLILLNCDIGCFHSSFLVLTFFIRTLFLARYNCINFNFSQSPHSLTVLPNGGILMYISNHLVAHQRAKENIHNMANNNCNITLINVGPNRIQVIKVLREILGIGLKEATDIANNVPYTFPQEYSLAFTDTLIDRLTGVGAILDLGTDEPAYDPFTYNVPTNNAVATTSSDTNYSSGYSMNEKTYTNKTYIDKTYIDKTYTDKTKTTSEELVDYFRDVFELERQIYTYDRIRQKYDREVTNINRGPEVHLDMEGEIPVVVKYRMGQGQSERIAKPEWLETEEYRNISSIQPRSHSGINRIALTFWTALGIFVIALILIFAIGRAGFFGLFWLAIPLFLVGTFFIGGYSFIDDRFPVDNREFAEKERRIRDYFQKCMDNEVFIIAENEQQLKRRLENECVELVVNPRENAILLLDKVYLRNIIFPKYRNFAAIAQIYEYLLSGRCTQLEGPNGAYNLYESELRQNVIISELNEINNQLSRLTHSMHTMCGAIRTTNSLLSNINSTWGRIGSNRALTDYNAQCATNNTHIANKYNI